MNAQRLLIVDDEPQLIRVLSPSLAAAGYEIETANTAGEALRAVSKRRFDAIILDLGLPDADGKDVISRVRNVASVPIIVLSARDEEREKIAALDLGANDFVSKPFTMGELMARVRAALRQRQGSPREIARIGQLEFDFTLRRFRGHGREVRLSPREAKLLRLFTDNLESVMTHEHISEAVWGPDQNVEPQFVRVLVANLRQKVEADPTRPKLIITEAGIGYRMRQPSE